MQPRQERPKQKKKSNPSPKIPIRHPIATLDSEQEGFDRPLPAAAPTHTHSPESEQASHAHEIYLFIVIVIVIVMGGSFGYPIIVDGNDNPPPMKRALPVRGFRTSCDTILCSLLSFRGTLPSVCGKDRQYS